MFHRRDLPSYFIAGGDDLLADYDMINDPGHPSVGGSGVPAPIDGIKGDGPNAGSYMATFGEDGRAIFINRPADALAENTDLLDDIVQSSVPVVIHQDGTAAGATASVLLNSGTGWVYVGPSGMANNATNRDRLIHVTDQTGAELEVSGTKVVCSLLHDGASANVIGTEADGFFEDPTANFSPSIPNGTTYRIHYGTRSSWATQALTTKGSIAEVQIRDVHGVAAEVRRLFRVLHTDAGTEVWNSAFDATVRALAMSGLNERYRRATTQPVGVVTGDYNDAGAGAVILRDGRAVEIQGSTDMILQNVGWKDGNHALLKLGIDTPRSDDSGAISGNKGGDFGVWHESEWKANNNNGDPGMLTRGESAGPALVDVIPYDMRESTFDGDTLFTFIDADDANATTTDSTFNVDCAPGNYFCLTGPVRTAIRLGLDMVEITDSNDLVRTFYIATLVSATRITVIGPAGTTASPFQAGTDAGCKLRIIQTVVSAGGYLGTPSSIFRRALTVIPPAILTTVVANESIPACAFFGSQTGSVADATAGSRRSRALEWGSTASPDSGGIVDGTITVRGWLGGDGSATVRRLLLTGGGAFIDEFGSAGFDDVVADTVTATFATVEEELVAGRIREMELHRYTTVDEDFLFFNKDGGAGADGVVQTAQGNWWWEQVSGTMTAVAEFPTAAGPKNPGVFRVLANGGVTATAVLRHGFDGIDMSRLDMADMVVAVNSDADNAHEAMTIGFSLDGTVALTSDQALAAYFTNADGWRLIHRRNGSDGAHHLASLGSFSSGNWDQFRFERNISSGLDIYRDGTLVLTVTSAELPVGLVNAFIRWEHSGSDTDTTSWLTDMFKYRVVVTTSNRSGPV